MTGAIVRLRRVPGEAWLLVALLLLPIITTQTYLINRETNLLVYAVLSLALHAVVGNTGQLHLGIAAFFGIGAYTTGILSAKTQPFGCNLGFAVVAATLISAAAGAALAAPALRLRGDYLALVTLGFGEVLRLALRNLDHITNGTKTITGISPPVDLPKPLIGGWLTQDRLNFYLMWLALAAVVFVLRRLENSRLGRAWIAVREDELAAGCMGLPVARVKLTAFVLGAALAGLAGSLYASLLGSTSDPDTYSFNRSAITLCCLILGGLGGVRGALLGTLILLSFDGILVPEVDSMVQGWKWAAAYPWLKLSTWKLMIFGLALILMMRFRPDGLWPTPRTHEEWSESTTQPPHLAVSPIKGVPPEEPA